MGFLVLHMYIHAYIHTYMLKYSEQRNVNPFLFHIFDLLIFGFFLFLYLTWLVAANIHTYTPIHIYIHTNATRRHKRRTPLYLFNADAQV